jgi:hypothetical protein
MDFMYTGDTGVNSFLSREQMFRANDEYEEYWRKKKVHGGRKRENAIQEPEETTLELQFDPIDPTNDGEITMDLYNPYQGFYFIVGSQAPFTIGKDPPEPGFALLKTFAARERVGWTEFNNNVISRGAVPQAFANMTPWNFVSFDFAVGNHDNATVDFVAKDQTGTIVRTEQRVVGTTPETITLNWTGIYQFEVVRVNIGVQHPNASRNEFNNVHWHTGYTNLKYTLD